MSMDLAFLGVEKGSIVKNQIPETRKMRLFFFKEKPIHVDPHVSVVFLDVFLKLAFTHRYQTETRVGDAPGFTAHLLRVFCLISARFVFSQSYPCDKVYYCYGYLNR